MSLFLSLFLAPAHAADLDTYLRAALETNPDVAAASARYDRARAGVDVARARLLPQISATAAYQRNLPEVLIVLPGTTTEVTLTPKDQLVATGRAVVPLIDASGIEATRAAGDQRRAEASQQALAVDGVLLRVVQAYWNAIAAARVEHAAELTLNAATESGDLARARAELEGASVLDVRRAEAEEARAKQLLLAAQADRRDAERALVTLTGVNDAPDEDATPRTAPDGDLNARALDANDQVKAARAGLDAARHQAASLALSYAPTVSAFGNLNMTNATGFSGQAATGNVGVQLAWTLADGGAREGRYAQARASVRESEARLEGLVRGVQDDVATAADQVATARASVEAATLGVEAAREAARLAEESYALGGMDTYQLTQARRDAFEAEVQAARAEAGLAIAVENLRMLVGDELLSASI